MTEAKKIVRMTIGKTYTGSLSPMFIETELDLDGMTPAEAIAKIQELQKEYESEYSDIRFDVYYDYSDDRSDHRRIYLTGEREETDEEFTTRLDEAAKRVAAQRERDERDLAAIAKRLGKTVV